MKDEKPPAPTRGLSPAEEGAADEEEDEEAGEDGADGPNIADLVPRNGIRWVPQVTLGIG